MRMDTERTQARKAERAAARASLRTMRRRRVRVLRVTALIIGVTALMVVLSMVTRDELEIRRCRKNLESIAAACHAYSRRSLPLLLPLSESQSPQLRGHYLYRPLNTHRLATTNPVGIGNCSRPHRLYFQSNGLHMLLYNGDAFEVVWIEEQDFRTRADSFALPVPYSW